MRLSVFMAGAASLCVVGFLGFRIIDLEQRVRTLSEQLGTPGQPAVTLPTSNGEHAAAPAPVKGFEQRLAAAEKRIDSLAAVLKGARIASDVKGDSPAHDEAILSVVERENSRIRDVQLEWHRTRWIEARQQALTMFSSQLQLQPSQTAALNHALESEIDNLIQVLKRPGFAEDPDQTASDWQAALSATDQRADQVLTPEQKQVWTQVRLFERRTLWPWLPPTDTTALK